MNSWNVLWGVVHHSVVWSALKRFETLCLKVILSVENCQQFLEILGTLCPEQSSVLLAVKQRLLTGKILPWRGTAIWQSSQNLQRESVCHWQVYIFGTAERPVHCSDVTNTQVGTRPIPQLFPPSCLCVSASRDVVCCWPRSIFAQAKQSMKYTVRRTVFHLIWHLQSNALLDEHICAFCEAISSK